MQAKYSSLERIKLDYNMVTSSESKYRIFILLSQVYLVYSLFFIEMTAYQIERVSHTATK